MHTLAHLSINLHTKFEVLTRSFINSKHMTGGPKFTNESCDPNHVPFAGNFSLVG